MGEAFPIRHCPLWHHQEALNMKSFTFWMFWCCEIGIVKVSGKLAFISTQPVRHYGIINGKKVKCALWLWLLVYLLIFLNRVHKIIYLRGISVALYWRSEVWLIIPEGLDYISFKVQPVWFRAFKSSTWCILQEWHKPPTKNPLLVNKSPMSHFLQCLKRAPCSSDCCFTVNPPASERFIA